MHIVLCVRVEYNFVRAIDKVELGTCVDHVFKLLESQCSASSVQFIVLVACLFAAATMSWR